VIIDPNGEGWLLVLGQLYWDPTVNNEKDARKKGGEYLPPGTIVTITRGTGPYATLTGHNVILSTAGVEIDLGKPHPIPIKEIEFYGGDGERFLLAYFKFALENAVAGYIGAKSIDAIEALYQLAKAKNAGKAAIELIEEIRGVCFAGETKVATREGDKPIGELREGDVVLSFDPDCGEPAWQQVTRVYERTAAELLDITVDGVKISCTAEHPFWVEANGWTPAKALKLGARLLSKDGHTLRVQSIRRRTGSFTVHNIEVERLHSYYVSEVGALVHNQCDAASAAKLKTVNLPAWKKIAIDMEHIASGHVAGGSRVSDLKDLFPTSMTLRQIEGSVREAYRYGSKLMTQGDRVLVEGVGRGLRIQMWVNRATRTVETAYPVH